MTDWLAVFRSHAGTDSADPADTFKYPPRTAPDSVSRVSSGIGGGDGDAKGTPAQFEAGAKGEPPISQPCTSRRGRVELSERGPFLHFCVECGRWGAHGYGVFLRQGQLGRWYCDLHRHFGDRGR